MARPEKVAVVDEIRAKLADADATVLTEYRGLSVHALADLRGSLRGSGTEYKVFKNTLARRAIEGAGYDEITTMFEGPVALAFVRGDAAAAAKALRDFGRDHPALVVKGGLLGERVITPADIEALAGLPTRDVMLTQVAGMFQAPLTKAAGLFQAFTRNFAYGVQALIDDRVSAGESLPEAETPAAEADAPAAEADAPAAEAESTESEPAEAESDAMATMTTPELLDVFKNMTVLELNDFLKAFEEEFGVTAAAPVAVAAAPTAGGAGGEAAAAEEQDEFDVVLAAAGDKKIQVIKEVRAIVSGLGLKEAKDLVDSAPKPVLEKVSKEDAEKAKAQLEEAGATVELR